MLRVSDVQIRPWTGHRNKLYFCKEKVKSGVQELTTSAWDSGPGGIADVQFPDLPTE